MVNILAYAKWGALAGPLGLIFIFVYSLLRIVYERKSKTKLDLLDYKKIARSKNGEALPRLIFYFGTLSICMLVIFIISIIMVKVAS